MCKQDQLFLEFPALKDKPLVEDFMIKFAHNYTYCTANGTKVHTEG